VRGEICAICCGTEREVTVDCPLDCIYLRESRRYDLRKPPSPASRPFPEVEIGDSFVAEHDQLIGMIGYELLRYAMENPATTDQDIGGALAGMVRTYETLSSGIYYESLPDQGSQIGVFRALKKFLDELEKKAREQGQLAGMKEGDVIRSLVFLARLAAVQHNQRPRSRAFIDFLRQTFPSASAKKEEPRLIVPGI